MKLQNYLFALAIFFVAISCNKSSMQQKTQALRDVVILKGEVQVEEIENIYIIPKYDLKNSITQQKVEKNKVLLEFHPKEFVQYSLTSRLGMATDLLSFYPDADTIYFSITSSEVDGMVVNGGELTNRFQTKLRESSLPLQKEVEKIQEKYGDYYENEISQRKVDSVVKAYRLRELNRLPENPDITDYSLLYNEIWIPQSVDPDFIESIVKRKEYLDKKVGNPIYDSIGNLMLQNLQGFHSLSVGKMYRDISAQDLKGSTVYLKDFVGKDEYLLLDFWATYCGPCISKSKKNIPVYKEFKDKGFGVFSVMTDVESESNYQKLVNKYAYPWMVYSDIGDKNHVKLTYGFKTMGGVQLLLNKEGEIVLHNPTQEELRAFLEENL